MQARPAGSLPASWAVPKALASLETLVVSANNLSGYLPEEWGTSPGAFPALKTLDVRQNGLEGYLPDAWGTSLQVIALAGLVNCLCFKAEPFECPRLPLSRATCMHWSALPQSLWYTIPLLQMVHGARMRTCFGVWNVPTERAAV